jgi:hypothetical protein
MKNTLFFTLTLKADFRNWAPAALASKVLRGLGTVLDAGATERT